MKHYLISIIILAAAYLSMPVAAAQGENDTLWTKRIKGATDVKFSPDGENIAMGRENGDIFILNAHDGTILQSYFHPKGGIIDYSPDGKFLATGGGGLEVPDSEKVKLWDLVKSKFVTNLIDTIKSSVTDIKSPKSIAFSKDGRFLIIGYHTGVDIPRNSNLVVWNMQNYTTISYLFYPKMYITKMRFMPNSKLLAVGFSYQKSNYVLLIDTETWDEKMPALQHPDMVRDFTFTSDGSKLISGCDDVNIRVWNTETRELEKNISMNDIVNSIAISNDDKYIFSGGIWGLKKIDLSNQKVVYNYNTNFNGLGYELISSISIPSKGQELAFGSSLTVGILKSDLLSNILEYKDQESELIFPNPATGIIKIAFLNPRVQFLTITIRNTNASLEDIIFKGDMEEGLQSIEYNSRKLHAGTYFIQISNSTFSKTFKLVKE